METKAIANTFLTDSIVAAKSTGDPNFIANNNSILANANSIEM